MNPLFILFSWKMNSTFSYPCLVMLGTCRPKNSIFFIHMFDLDLNKNLNLFIFSFIKYLLNFITLLLPKFMCL
ncbi:hypothetical protein M6B38_318925 [Iris pallida]|uniref:NADH dehydrogenase subunit 4 n=1 Tax=Iris pallida TaxID=29817 RepID=A0AAX6HDQ3_IRIPA|nr:hypothetical protein M6B38_132800 [Iris pallida]KAJ6838734.1 hypothetical protein M6B38_318925 [Iris pallida]